jgi:hypothetical protein
MFYQRHKPGMIFVLIVILLSIQACNANSAGIEQPVTIDGIRIQITGVSSNPMFVLDDQGKASGASDRIYLAVIAIASGDTVNQLERISDWEVTLSDNKGRVYTPDPVRIGYDSDRLRGTVIWDFFLVQSDADSFALNLPNTRPIKLDSLRE